MDYPKLIKHLTVFFFFLFVIDTTGTNYYSAGKYLSGLFHIFKQSMYTVKDYFDAANKNYQTLPNVTNTDEYVFVALDLVLLLTSIPFKKAVDINLKHMCTDKENGVSMGGYLEPELANIIWTECEKVIVNQLIEKNIVKLIIRYLVDNLLIIRKKRLDVVLNKFNSFNKNSKSTINAFEDWVSHFLDIDNSPNNLDVYHKSIHWSIHKYQIVYIVEMENIVDNIINHYKQVNMLTKTS